VILADIVKRNLALSAERTALIFEGRHYNYRAFTDRVYRLANALLALGLAPQDRVAVLAQNCNEYLEAYCACEVSGIIMVPLNHRLTLRELTLICADCSPRLLIAQAEFAELADGLVENTASIGRTIQLAEEYEALLQSASATEPPVRPRPQDIAYLIYTSGTTGRPKGVMLSQSAVAAAAGCLALDCGARGDDRMLICMPFFHIGGRIEQLSFTLLGATIVLHRSFDETAVLRSMADERITAAHLAPTMIQRLLDLPDIATADLSQLNSVHYASAPMPVPLLRRAIGTLGPVFTQVYGMTECIVCSVLKPHQHVLEGDAAERRRLASAGQPFFGCEIRIAADDGCEVPRGDVGEILVKSPALMTGYWNNTAATIEALRDGWMRTADLGSMDADGFVTIVDRKKDMIISGGENIYSWEVEEALRSHPAVAEAAVIGVPDETWGESVKAFVVRVPGEEVSAEVLIAHCREQIASYKKPRSVEFIDGLPRMFHGKIDKKALRDPHWVARSRNV
jgi:acyl-CoA synthetase (AMP-forming)/AMP-acid ligase II